MEGEIRLSQLLKSLNPVLQPGEYVFCLVADLSQLHGEEAILVFKEAEGITVILEKQVADRLQLRYSLITAWITLTVHSSLAAIGLTAAFTQALAAEGISCNIVAAFYHDHIFVPVKDSKKAIETLIHLSKKR
jgi:uncharacterized protein